MAIPRRIGVQMRQLILLRHAKAVAGAPDGDHARPLSARGVAEATQAGSAIGAQVRPDYALVSDARRTRETFDRLVEALGYDVPHRFERALYGAAPDAILSVIATAGSDIDRLLVIGHNPGLGELARQLAGGDRGAAGGDMAERFPTAAFALIDLDEPDWVRAASGSLRAFVTVDSNESSD